MKGISTFVSIMVSTIVYITSTHAAPALAPRALPPTLSVNDAKNWLRNQQPQAEANANSYDRDNFGNWITVHGNCNTREIVLQRDATNFHVDGNCKTEGRWHSLYDNKDETDRSKIDIDHLVPLAEAWRSGASGWSEDKLVEFANDLVQPQLIAVTGSINRSKSDQDPGTWLPPQDNYKCTYVLAWITVKKHYELTLDAREYGALWQVLYNVCH